MAHFFTITMNCKMQKFPVRAKATYMNTSQIFYLAHNCMVTVTATCKLTVWRKNNIHRDDQDK